MNQMSKFFAATRTSLLLGLLLLIINACNSQKATTSNITETITGTYRVLQLAATDLTNNPIQLTFDPANQSVFGNTGCNDFFAAYTIEGQHINIKGIGQTKMICDDPAMDIERSLTHLLGNRTGWSRKKDTLTLTGNGSAQDNVIAIKIAN